jgi:formate/nitrite transporter FocA (FNT family)
VGAIFEKIRYLLHCYSSYVIYTWKESYLCNMLGAILLQVMYYLMSSGAEKTPMYIQVCTYLLL